MFPTFVVIEKFLFLCHFKLRKLLKKVKFNNFEVSKEKRHVVHSLIVKNDIKIFKKLPTILEIHSQVEFSVKILRKLKKDTEEVGKFSYISRLQ